MIRLSLAYFYDVGQALQRLRHISDMADPNDARSVVNGAIDQLRGLYSQDILTSLMKTSLIPSQQLVKALDSLNERVWNTPVSAVELLSIASQLNNWETVFKSEMVVADAYYVSEKKG